MWRGERSFLGMSWLCLAMLCLTIRAVAAEPSVALFYGENPPWDELRAFDVVVVDPDHGTISPANHQHADSSVFAYVSLGEVHPTRPWFNELPTQWQAGQNSAWGSVIIDQAAAGYPAFVTDKVIAPLWDKGYRGFFLDTLDTWHLIAKTPEAQARQQAGLIATIRAIKARFPDAKLIFNRGFEILPTVHDLAWMVAAESLFQGHDASKNSATEVSAADREWLLAQLGSVRERYKLPVLVIDYVPSNQRELARKTAEKIRALGMIPWVTTPGLDAMGVGAVEVLPRKVLVLWNPTTGGDNVFYAEAQRFLSMPLAYLGLVPEYITTTSSPPTTEMIGRYAGVVSWQRDPQALDGTGWLPWLRAQADKGLPLAMMGTFGSYQDEAALRQFGIESPQSNPGPGMQVVHQDAMMGFELPVLPRTTELQAVRLAGEGKPLLTLQRGSEQWHPAALTPWGGYVLAPYTVGSLLGGDQEMQRWYVNPVSFLRAALRIDGRVPIPDVTTENGRRLFFSHIDGDGFASQFEGTGFRFAGEVLRDEIVQRYRLPLTMSVIEGETGAAGLYPQLTPRLEKAARDIYALPWVEAATHSYSHPFHWGNAEQSADSVEDSGEGYHLPIKGYRFDMAREISGSADYINRQLLPAGKRVGVMLWTGNCVATPNALEEADRAGLLNMNGGETRITRSKNTWTLMAGLGLQRNDHFQVFAPNQNENVYTNLWTGPFYGFERVIETFELTDRPYRFKPVNLYYHTYSASKPAALNALHRIYAWVDKQSLHPIFGSEYIRKVHDFNRMVVARTPTGFSVRGTGDLRTLRLPQDQGIGLDWKASEGVAGSYPAPEGRYVSLTGAAAELVLAPSAAALPYLAEANARLTEFARDGKGLSFGFAGHVPLSFALANAQGCRLTAGGRPLLPYRQAAGLNHYRMEQHAESAFKLNCGA
jgi:hypothetical protein